MKEHEILLALKVNKLLLYKDKNRRINKIIQDKLAVKNVFTLYSLSELYKLPIASETSLLYIERCFPMVVETENFVHLDYSFVAKILASSELNIHSEVEIFNALITWIKHNSEERSKYAKQLLLKVRFAFLSEYALKHISNWDSIFSKNHKCVKLIKMVLDHKKSLIQNNPSSFYTNRYCSPAKFNILVCGGYNFNSCSVVANVNSFNVIKDFPSMKEARRNLKAVCLKGEVFVFGGIKTADNLSNNLNIHL